MEAVKKLLEEMGMGIHYPAFRIEKVDINTIPRLTDSELSRLGLQTIGERARLRERVKKELAAGPTEEIQTQINSLFRSSSSRTSLTRRRNSTKQPRQRTWTAAFVCMANKNTSSVPSVKEKQILLAAGLGVKKMQLCDSHDEENVYSELISAFPKLKDCGGFELMRCQSNFRDLMLVDTRWSVEKLKEAVGQSKVYIRPVQKSLSTEPLERSSQSKSDLKEICVECNCLINLSELRNHSEECFGTTEIPVNDFGDVEAEIQSDTQAQDAPPTISWDSNITEEQPSNANTQAPHVHVPGAILSESNMTEEQPNADTQAPHVPPAVLSETNITAELHDVSQTDNNDIDSVIENCINYIQLNNISNPVEILRYIQSKIIQGRSLDVQDIVTEIEGETNFIIVNRNDLLRTAFEEINSISNYRVTLEVQFYDECAVDLGGPRKEFFQLLLQEIQEKYFNPLKEWSSDYETIGKVFALSTLQNGKLPRLLTPELLEEVFDSASPRPFVQDLRKGLDSLRLFKLTTMLHPLKHLFTPHNVPLTMKMLTQLIKPKFSPDGANRKVRESLVYTKFLRYLRETASGRRGDITMGKVLQFTTGTDEEPVMGFNIHPSIEFVESYSFLPSANTCINRLCLTWSYQLIVCSTNYMTMDS